MRFQFIQNTLIMRLTALKGVVSRAKGDFEQFALTNEEAQVSKNNQFINDKIGVFQEVLSTSLLNLTMHCNDQIDHISAIKVESSHHEFGVFYCSGLARKLGNQQREGNRNADKNSKRRNG